MNDTPVSSTPQNPRLSTRSDASVEEILLAYIREQCLPRNTNEAVEYEENLFESGIVDSAGLISFLSYIEGEFGLSIPDEDLLPENFLSIARIAAYIRAHQQVDDE